MGKDFVGQRDLAGVDGPFAFVTQDGCALAGGAEAIGVVEVAEGAVDRAQAVGAAGDQHAVLGEMPGVGPMEVAPGFGFVGEHAVIGVHAADDGGAGAGAGGVVGDAEAHGFETLAALRYRFHVAMPRRFDEHFEPSFFLRCLAASIWVTSMSMALDVGRKCRPWDEDHVEPRAASTMSMTSRYM